jgi:NAD-dependent dihydropyrimidine dehydrogenase PreA subunit
MKVTRKIIQIDEELCNGCGQCVTGCAEGALEVVDGKARVISDNLCDGLGACIGECPTGALKIVEREADAFDEVAVEARLAGHADPTPLMPLAGGGCPSAGVRMFAPQEALRQDPQGRAAAAAMDSALSHWPVKLRLVPPKAPFLRGADLLVLADCAAIAFPNLHPDYLKGRVVLSGCPKFDEVEAYVRKFAEIFQEAGIRSVTAVRMEVPCCAALVTIVAKGMEAARVSLPIEEVVIGVQGKVQPAALKRSAARAAH